MVPQLCSLWRVVHQALSNLYKFVVGSPACRASNEPPLTRLASAVMWQKRIAMEDESCFPARSLCPSWSPVLRTLAPPWSHMDWVLARLAGSNLFLSGSFPAPSPATLRHATLPSIARVSGRSHLLSGRALKLC